jgi:hypothetical protein
MYINELKIKITLKYKEKEKKEGGRGHIEPLLLLQVPPL